MISIPVGHGYCAVVDQEDAHLSQYKWHPLIRKRSDGSLRIYARRSFWDKEARRVVTRLMHREILKGPREIDHWDGDGLNNCRNNLRAATGTQNMQNRRKQKSSSSFKGVTKRTDGWCAQVQVRGKKINIGTFKDEVDAATAYNFAAEEAFGEFFRGNVPL